MELTEDNVRPNKELLLNNNTNVRANSDNSRGRDETTMCQFYASDGFMYVPLSTRSSTNYLKRERKGHKLSYA